MGNYRHDAILAVVGTVALLPVAMLPILAHVVRRFGALRGWPMITAVGLLGSAVTLAAFTVFPMPDLGSLHCDATRAMYAWQTQPFASISQMSDARRALGFPDFLWSPPSLQVLLNVGLFVPFGFFLHQVTRWNWLGVTFASLVVSSLIEITQGTAVFGLYACPYRVLDVDDVIVNTIGGVVGVLLSYGVIRAFHWTTPPRDPDLRAPSFARRATAAALDVALVLVLDFVIIAGDTIFTALTDGRATTLNTLGTSLPDRASDVIAVVALVVLAPLMRRDRATPGQVVVNIAPARSIASADPARAWQALVRALVRWAPIVIFQMWGVLAMAAVEVVSMVVRADGRTLSAFAARTLTRTKPAMRARVVSEPTAVEELAP